MNLNLKLPVIRQAIPTPKTLRMDDYLDFVQFGLTLIVDWKTIRSMKKKSSVKKPFTFKQQ